MHYFLAVKKYFKSVLPVCITYLLHQIINGFAIILWSWKLLLFSFSPLIPWLIAFVFWLNYFFYASYDIWLKLTCSQACLVSLIPRPFSTWKQYSGNETTCLVLLSPLIYIMHVYVALSTSHPSLKGDVCYRFCPVIVTTLWPPFSIKLWMQLLSLCCEAE